MNIKICNQEVVFLCVTYGVAFSRYYYYISTKEIQLRKNLKPLINHIQQEHRLTRTRRQSTSTYRPKQITFVDFNNDRPFKSPRRLVSLLSSSPNSSPTTQICHCRVCPQDGWPGRDPVSDQGEERGSRRGFPQKTMAWKIQERSRELEEGRDRDQCHKPVMEEAVWSSTPHEVRSISGLQGDSFQSGLTNFKKPANQVLRFPKFVFKTKLVLQPSEWTCFFNWSNNNRINCMKSVQFCIFLWRPYIHNHRYQTINNQLTFKGIHATFLQVNEKN